MTTRLTAYDLFVKLETAASSSLSPGEWGRNVSSRAVLVDEIVTLSRRLDEVEKEMAQLRETSAREGQP